MKLRLRSSRVFSQSNSSYSPGGLARMERERPDLALTFQRFLMLELAGKVSDTNRLLEAEML